MLVILNLILEMLTCCCLHGCVGMSAPASYTAAVGAAGSTAVAACAGANGPAPAPFAAGGAVPYPIAAAPVTSPCCHSKGHALVMLVLIPPHLVSLPHNAIADSNMPAMHITEGHCLVSTPLQLLLLPMLPLAAAAAALCVLIDPATP